MRSVLVATGMLLVLLSGLLTAEEPAPWQGLAPSAPFKNLWSARIQDQDGTHRIVNGWVEREYRKSGRRVSKLAEATIGEEATEALEAELSTMQVEKLMFVETDDHRLYAIEAESGVVKWVSYFPRAIQYRPHFGATYIYLTSNETLFAINREYGLLAWRLNLTYPVSTSLIEGDSGLLYLCSWENRVMCLDNETRQFTWQFRTQGDIVATPVYASGLIYVPSDDGSIYCLKSTGELSFEFATNGPIRTSPCLREGFLFVASADNSVYCLNRYSGSKVWECRIGRPVYEAPEVIENTVYVRPFGKGITAISVETGKILWEMPYTDKIIGYGRNVVYLYTGEHRNKLVLGVEHNTGTIDWVWDPKENIKEAFDAPLSNVHEVNKVFFVRNNPGRIFTLGEKGFYEKMGEKRDERAAAAVEAAEGAEDMEPAAGDDTAPADDLEDLLDIEGL